MSDRQHLDVRALDDQGGRGDLWKRRTHVEGEPIVHHHTCHRRARATMPCPLPPSGEGRVAGGARRGVERRRFGRLRIDDALRQPIVELGREAVRVVLRPRPPSAGVAEHQRPRPVSSASGEVDRWMRQEGEPEEHRALAVHCVQHGDRVLQSLVDRRCAGTTQGIGKTEASRVERDHTADRGESVERGSQSRLVVEHVHRDLFEIEEVDRPVAPRPIGDVRIPDFREARLHWDRAYVPRC